MKLYHACSIIKAAIHGDDFTVLGSAEDLNWFRKKISDKFEVKFRGRIGPSSTDDKAVRLLNRVFEWTPEGIVIEADQRHAELIVKDMGLASDSKGMSTPGVKMRREEEEAEEGELPNDQSTIYRANVARANYMSQDRSDVQFSVKELCRKMSKPSESDWKKLKRLARYLVDKTRSRTIFEYQGKPGNIEVHIDTDFAGCQRTRKSTSGGVLKFGGHLLKTWSSTQNVIALSSGEAEYYGLVKGVSQGLGVKAMLAELGVETSVTVKTDASAARGIAMRRGMGKVRHIEVNQLWVQDKVAKGIVKIQKIATTENLADHLTKYLSQEGICEHMHGTGQWLEDGRHHLMPNVASE